MSLSKIVVSGKVTKAPGKRFTPSTDTAIAEFGLAVQCQRKTGEPLEIMLLKVITWRDTADRCIAEVASGDWVTVSGRLQINNYVDKDGGKHRSVEVEADSFEVQRRDLAATGEVANSPPPHSSGKRATDVDLDVLFASEDEIPF